MNIGSEALFGDDNETTEKANSSEGNAAERYEHYRNVANKCIDLSRAITEVAVQATLDLDGFTARKAKALLPQITSNCSCIGEVLCGALHSFKLYNDILNENSLDAAVAANKLSSRVFAGAMGDIAATTKAIYWIELLAELECISVEAKKGLQEKCDEVIKELHGIIESGAV